MNEYDVTIECWFYPEKITYVLEAESFADAEAKTLKIYDINCSIISIILVQGTN